MLEKLYELWSIEKRVSVTIKSVGLNCTCNEYEMTVVYNETTITINWEEDYI